MTVTALELNYHADLTVFSTFSIWTTKGVKSISTGDLLSKTIKSELIFWKEVGFNFLHLLETSRNNQVHREEAPSPFNDIVTALSSLISVLKNPSQAHSIENGSPAERLTAALKRYETSITNSNLPTLTKTVLSVIREHAKSNKNNTAREVLLFLLNKEKPNYQFEFRHFQLLYDIALLQKPPRVFTASTLKMEEQISSAEALRFELENNLSAIDRTAKSELEATKASAVQHLQEINGLLEEAKKSLANTRKESEELKKWFEQVLPVSEIVSLWRKKERQHQTAFIGWGVGSAILLLISIFALLAMAPSVAFPPKPTEVIHLIRWGVGLSLSIWVARIGLKFSVTNFKLREDARERSVMASTFMSLERSKELDTSLRASVLSALFRPSGVDSGGEDGPVLLSALLQGLESKNKKD